MDEEALEEYKKKRELDFARRFIAKKSLSADALERLSNIRAGSPALYDKIVEVLLALQQSGRLQGKLSDEDFKKLLARLLPKKRETRIIRK